MVGKRMSTAPRAGSNGHSTTPHHDPKSAVEIKGSVFTLTVLRITSTDIDAIETNLAERIAQAPRFFEHAPVVLDLEHVKAEPTPLDLAAVAQTCRKLKLVPVGVRNANVEYQQAAVAAGLAILRGGAVRELSSSSTEASPNNVGQRTAKEPSETRRAVEAPAVAVEPAAPGRADNKTVYHPIRSGQQIYNAHGDLTLLAAVNAGAEVVADGNIHLYAPLRGRALAGVRGDNRARIFCQSFEAELVSVAGHYRVFEDKVPAEFYRRPVQIYLNDKEQLIIEPLA